MAQKSKKIDMLAGKASRSFPLVGMGLYVLPVLFLFFVVAAVFTGQLPLLVAGLYLVASCVTFLAYWYDKSAARNDGWRIKESRLHGLSLVGGWPGAFVAQKLLRHKSRKPSFRIVFWTTVLLNCAGLVWFFSPSAVEVLLSFFCAAR